jgi:hypothetical protein
MSNEGETKGGEEDVPGERTYHARRFDGIALVALGLCGTLFVALGVSYRDNQNALTANVTSFEIRVSEQLREIGTRLRSVEERVWRR